MLHMHLFGHTGCFCGPEWLICFSNIFHMNFVPVLTHLIIYNRVKPNKTLLFTFYRNRKCCRYDEMAGNSSTVWGRIFANIFATSLLRMRRKDSSERQWDYPMNKLTAVITRCKCKIESFWSKQLQTVLYTFKTNVTWLSKMTTKSKSWLLRWLDVCTENRRAHGFLSEVFIQVSSACTETPVH